MEFTASAKKKRRHITIKADDGLNKFSSEQFPHPLSLYIDPPSGLATLDDIKEAADLRYRLLQAVENVSLSHVRFTPEWSGAMHTAIEKLGTTACLKTAAPDGSVSPADVQARQWDVLSHFMLRLAVCQRGELRKWFLEQETSLFWWRLSRESGDSRNNFLNINNLSWKILDEVKKKELLEKLADASNISITKASDTIFYQVPWELAADLVRIRSCLVRGGLAYLAQEDAVTLVLQRFRTLLSRSVALTAQLPAHLGEDDRLLPLLQDVVADGGAGGQQNFEGVDNITAANIETFVGHFPPCMRRMYDHVKKEHHSKHTARLQLGLFLKGIGMEMSEALKWWKSEFTRRMEPAKFDKEHAYNIRYNFGKEGARVNYTPYGCMKIITTNPPAVGESHGCPFRTLPTDLLRPFLVGLHKFNKEEMDEMTELSTRTNYAAACTRFFEHTRQVKDTGILITHPNQYFDESVKLAKGGPIGENHAAASMLAHKVPANLPVPVDSTMLDEFAAEEMET